MSHSRPDHSCASVPLSCGTSSAAPKRLMAHGRTTRRGEIGRSAPAAGVRCSTSRLASFKRSGTSRRRLAQLRSGARCPPGTEFLAFLCRRAGAVDRGMCTSARNPGQPDCTGAVGIIREGPRRAACRLPTAWRRPGSAIPRARWPTARLGSGRAPPYDRSRRSPRRQPHRGGSWPRSWDKTRSFLSWPPRSARTAPALTGKGHAPEAAPCGTEGGPRST